MVSHCILSSSPCERERLLQNERKEEMTQVRKSAWVVEKPFIYHRITVGGDGFGVFTGHGFAKCHPNDSFDKAIGKELAELRAKVKAYEGYTNMLAKELQRVKSTNQNAVKRAKSAGRRVDGAHMSDAEQVAAANLATRISSAEDPLADFLSGKWFSSLPKVTNVVNNAG